MLAVLITPIVFKEGRNKKKALGFFFSGCLGKFIFSVLFQGRLQFSLTPKSCLQHFEKVFVIQSHLAVSFIGITISKTHDRNIDDESFFLFSTDLYLFRLLFLRIFDILCGPNEGDYIIIN